jgi:hypothetical protein
MSDTANRLRELSDSLYRQGFRSDVVDLIRASANEIECLDGAIKQARRERDEARADRDALLPSVEPRRDPRHPAEPGESGEAADG